MTLSRGAGLLGAVLVGALLLRLALLVVLPESSRETADSKFYFMLAENIASGHGFSSQTEAPYTPSIERPPGYPAFLAGVSLLSGGSKGAVSVAQLALDVAAVFLVFLAARRRFGFAPALGAAAFYGLLPFSAGVSLQFMSEGLASFCVALALYAHTRALDERPERWGLVAGLAWGLAALSRSYLAPIAAVAGLVLWWELRARGSKRGFVGFAALGLGAALLVAPWVARNAYVASTTEEPFVLLERFGSRGVFLKMYTPEFRAWYQSYDEPFYWMDWKKPPRANYLTPEEKAEVAALWEQIAVNEGEVTDAMSARFAAVTAERYRRAPLRLYVWRPVSVALKFWASPRTSTVRFAVAGGSGLPLAGPWVKWMFLALNLAFAGFAALGIVALLVRRKPAVFLWAPPLVLTVILTVIVHRESRLVMPMFPFVAIAAGLGVEVVRRRLARR